MGSLLGSSRAWPQSCVLLLAPGCDTHPLDSFPDLVGQPTSASGWLWGLGESCYTNPLLWEGHLLILPWIIRVLSAALGWAHSISLWWRQLSCQVAGRN